jgi:hypothetical protein
MPLFVVARYLKLCPSQERSYREIHGEAVEHNNPLV